MTTPLPVYIAAPYADAPLVRAVAARLATYRAVSTATWSNNADGPEQLAALPIAQVRRLAATNDRDLLASCLVLVLAREGAGGEMFAEVRLALEYGISVVWVGARRPLSAYREGVLRVDDVDAALDVIATAAELVDRPWPVDEDWARDFIWSSFAQIEDCRGDVTAKVAA